MDTLAEWGIKMDQKKKVGMSKIIKKEAMLIIVALIIGFAGTIYINGAKELPAEEVQKGLASHVIRFHVLANSDSEEDQALKLEVRDAVIEEMHELLIDAQSIDETRIIINENMNMIEAIAREIIIENGKDYDVTVELDNEFFPTRAYGDVVLPTGEYEALRILIGEAEGKNWWCVMFPPLCFVDVTHGIVPDESKEELKSFLTEEEYNMVLGAKREEDIPVKVKFKIAEVINESSEKQAEKKTGIMTYLFGWAF
jgi:stage II sporulation protein R